MADETNSNEAQENVSAASAGSAADGPHIAAIVTCRLCGDMHVAVYPADIDEEDNMECANCGHMTCEPNWDDK